MQQFLTAAFFTNAFKAPPLSPRSLVTFALLAGIAVIDIFLTPTLHVGIFLYPVSILTALWWGGERAVVYVTGLAFVLTMLEQWSHPLAAYTIETNDPLIGATNNAANLLLLLLFGTACLYVAHQQNKYQHAQESLTDLEAKLTAVVRLTPDALILADADGNIVYWSTSAVKMFGYSEDEALGQALLTIMPKRFQEGHLKGFRRACESGNLRLGAKPIEVTGLRKDGREFPIELLLATWQTKGKRFFSGFIRDLTERKRLETRQSVQLAISQILMESETVEQAGSNILQAVGHLTDWEVGLIWLLEPRTKTLRCATVWEKSSKQALESFLRKSLTSTFVAGVGLPGRVLASGEPDWITNVVQDGNFPRLDLAREANLHAAFGFPIKGTQGVLGVIEFFAQEVRAPDTGLLHTFADIGLKVGQFVERKHLADETNALIRDLQAATSANPTIRGLLPICATCKRIRDPKGDWQEVENFILAHSTAQFSHTVCATCARQVHPDWDTA